MAHQHVPPEHQCYFCVPISFKTLKTVTIQQIIAKWLTIKGNKVKKIVCFEDKSRDWERSSRGWITLECFQAWGHTIMGKGAPVVDTLYSWVAIASQRSVVLVSVLSFQVTCVWCKPITCDTESWILSPGKTGIKFQNWIHSMFIYAGVHLIVKLVMNIQFFLQMSIFHLFTYIFFSFFLWRKSSC